MDGDSRNGKLKVAADCNRLQKFSVLTGGHVVVKFGRSTSMTTKILRYTGTSVFLLALFLSAGATQALAKTKNKPRTVSVPEGGAVPMLAMTAGVLGAAMVLARREGD